MEKRKNLKLLPFGIESLTNLNYSLLAKWAQKLVGGHAIPRASQIRSTYHSRRRSGFKARKSFSSLSPIWKDISKDLNAFWNCTAYKLGNRDNVPFWEDTWVGSVHLALVFKKIYAISIKINIYIPSPRSWKKKRRWSLKFFGPPTHSELIQMNALFFLSMIQLNLQDQWMDLCGSLQAMGALQLTPISSLVKEVSFGHATEQFGKPRSRKRLEYSCSLAWKNRSNIGEVLIKKGWVSNSNRRFFCGSDPETIFHQHLVSLELYLNIAGCPKNINDSWTSQRAIKIKRELRMGWDRLVLAVCWDI